MADEPEHAGTNLPAPASAKPSLLEWIESFLPFTIPRIPLPQAAKNLDKALARIVDAGGNYHASNIEQTSRLQDAQTNATIDFIKRGSREIGKSLASGDDALRKRSIEAAIGEHIQSQRNREAIAKAAVKELKNDMPQLDATAAIDDDWLNLFASIASKKSTTDMQSLWGKLLAGEIRQPGAFKLRTLQSLSVLDATEATLIHKHMSFVFDRHMMVYGQEYKLISYATLLELQALDVIQEAGGNTHVRVAIPAGTPGSVLLGANEVLHVENEKDDEGFLRNICPLTPFGRDLYRLAKPDRCAEGVALEIANQLRRKGRRIVVLELGARTCDGMRPVLAETDMSEAGEAKSS